MAAPLRGATFFLYNEVLMTDLIEKDEVVSADDLRGILHSQIDEELDKAKRSLHDLIDRLLSKQGAILLKTQKEVLQARYLEKEADLLYRVEKGRLASSEKQAIAVLRGQMCEQGLTQVPEKILAQIMLLGHGFTNYPDHAIVMVKLLEWYGTGRVWKMDELTKTLKRAESTIREKLSTIRAWLGNERYPYALWGTKKTGWSLVEKQERQ